MLDAMAHMHGPDELIALHAIETRRQLALAHAGLGDRTAARSMLGQLLQRPEVASHPLLLSLLHLAAAKVALLEGAGDDLARHVAQARRVSREMGHPGVIAQCEQLLEEARAVGFARDLR